MDALDHQDGLSAILPSFRKHQTLQKPGLLHHGTEYCLRWRRMDDLFLTMRSISGILPPRSTSVSPMPG